MLGAGIAKLAGLTISGLRKMAAESEMANAAMPPRLGNPFRGVNPFRAAGKPPVPPLPTPGALPTSNKMLQDAERRNNLMMHYDSAGLENLGLTNQQKNYLQSAQHAQNTPTVNDRMLRSTTALSAGALTRWGKRMTRTNTDRSSW